jgi:hypothetical protein
MLILQILIPVATFLLGAVVGKTLFIKKMQNNPAIFETLINPLSSRIKPITALAANGIFRQYYTLASSLNARLKGFAVNKDQLSAMNSISSQNSSLVGFRIYLAKSSTVYKSIIVGILSNGRDSTSNTIYETELTSSGPCPDVCDAESPITVL